MKTATLKTTKARRADPPSSIQAIATIAALTAKECDIMLAFMARKEKIARRRSINGHQATPFGQDGLREILEGFPTSGSSICGKSMPCSQNYTGCSRPRSGAFKRNVAVFPMMHRQA